MTYRTWLLAASDNLRSAEITTARLDAELLLAHHLSVTRTWLHAHADDPLRVDALQLVNALLARRLAREPIAYITGRKEFFGREFVVTPDVLVPRPESETMIELLAELCAGRPPQHTPLRLHDVGTGSGCLGITAKLEIPQLDVTLSDISPDALAVARQNAVTLQAQVTLIESDLLHNLPLSTDSLDFMLANLPYVNRSWETAPELSYEPELALYAEDHGLRLINKLIGQTNIRIAANGYLLLEADPDQHQAIIQSGTQNGLTLETVRGYIVVLRKSYSLY